MFSTLALLFCLLQADSPPDSWSEFAEQRNELARQRVIERRESVERPAPVVVTTRTLSRYHRIRRLKGNPAIYGAPGTVSEAGGPERRRLLEVEQTTTRVYPGCTPYGGGPLEILNPYCAPCQSKPSA
jgi:hypothetical protein